jgi:penicillin-binding protein 2
LIKQIESYEGRVLKEFKPQAIDQTRLDPKTYELVKQGLWGVVNSPNGTAFSQRLPGMDFLGKTGTVQVIGLAANKVYQKCENMKFRQRHHGMFAGFAPAKDPVIAVAVVAEHSCHGATGAAPIARAVVKAYLEKYFPQLYSPQVLAERLKTLGQSAEVPISFKAENEEDLVPDVANPNLIEDNESSGDSESDAEGDAG